MYKRDWKVTEKDIYLTQFLDTTFCNYCNLYKYLEWKKPVLE